MPSVEHAYAEEATVEIPRFGIWAHTLQHAGSYANPYREVSATAQLTAPGGTSVRRLPLFWDGGTTWRLRFSPDVIGTWQWHTRSNDSGLDGASGTFEVVPSDRKGSLRPMSGYPHHFERQDGSRTCSWARRNAGPFAVDAPQNDDWEAQIQRLPALFGATAWWRLQPRDDLVRCPVERGNDRTIDGLLAPPLSAYWCLAEPGEQYVLYVRGLTVSVQLSLDAAAATYVVRQFSPRSGEYEHLVDRHPNLD